MTAAQHLKRWFRLARFALHVLRGMAITTFLFPLQSRERRKREIEHWSMQLLTLLRIRLFLHGMPPRYGSRPLVIVANHVSWLDIFAINAVMPSRFIAKSEVRGWPFIGWLSARTGTLYIRRAQRHDTARINTLVAEALEKGDVLAMFPEGTTTDGSTVQKFHASLFEPALKAHAAVVPVAIWYDRSDGSLCTEVAYDGDRSVWDVLMGVTSQHEVLAHIGFLSPVTTGARHRREVAQDAERAIHRALFPQARHDTAERAEEQSALAN